MRFPLTAVGAPLLAGPLDGGTVFADNVTIGLDGTAAFQFQTALGPGLYRLMVNAGGQIITLRFSVPNPPEESPSPSPLPTP